MKNTRKLSLKNLKLAAKASITIGFILAVSLILLIVLSSVQAGTAVSSAINGEFPVSRPRTDLKLQAHISLPDDDYSKNDYCSKY